MFCVGGRLINAITINEAKDSSEIKTALPKIYSMELVNLLFIELYNKIAYIEKGLGVSSAPWQNEK